MIKVTLRSVFATLVMLLFFTLSSNLRADIFITEIADPNNNADARFVELYNNGTEAVDLSTGWALQRWTNGNTDPQSPVALTGTIAAGGFYIVCNNATEFSSVYGFDADQDIGTGGPADSNGDDNIALLDASGAIHDMFGVAGEDGSGTDHEFEDGRAERKETVTAATATWDVNEWNIDNDSGGGDGPQDAPEAFDPGAWIGTGGDAAPSVTGVNQEPAGVTSSDVVTITATVTDDNGLSSVLLKYATGGAYSDVTMLDDGAHGDGAAGDNVYGGSIPAQSDETVVTYYVSATDDASQTTTNPATAPTDTYSYTVHDDQVPEGAIVINEIMYNSAGTDTEYVEIYNTTNGDISLENWTFKDDDDSHIFTFPAGSSIGAGAYLVVCADTDEVKLKYGITNVIGNFSFGLNNSGDAARIFDQYGILKDIVTFTDSSPWPTEADGDGPSLELKNPTLDNSLAENWSASSGAGTPGSQNSTFVSAMDKRSGMELRGFQLYPNFPNPFNPSTSIRYQLSAFSHVDLSIYNNLGQKVVTLIRGDENRGLHTIQWNGKDANGQKVSSGIYYTVLKAEQQVQTHKMVLMK